MLVGEMALGIRLLAKRGKGLRAIAREIGYPSGEPHLPFQVKPLSSVLMDDLKVAHKYGG